MRRRTDLRNLFLASIDAVMAAAALAGLFGRLEDQQRRQDAVAQADDRSR